VQGRAAFFVVGTLVVAVACSSGGGDPPPEEVALPDRVAPPPSEGDADMPDGAPDDVSAPDAGFSPASFAPRLVLWLDSERAVGVDGGRVGTWGDQSGNANHAAQAAIALEPTVLAPGSDGGVAGHTLVAFNGNERLAIAENATLIWGKEDFAIVVVFRHTTPTNTFGLIVGKYDQATPFPGPNLYANYFAPTQTTQIAARVDGPHYVKSAASGLNDGKIHVAAIRRAGTSVEVRVDGAPTVNPEAGAPEGGAIDVSAPAAPITIGARPNGSAGLVGGIAEIVGLRGSISDAEITQLEAYFRAKYGL
jgi:hypothetical protein